jgi:hypothetical protein
MAHAAVKDLKLDVLGQRFASREGKWRQRLLR